MPDKILKSLSSTRLAIFLLIILTLLSVIGIVIPQGMPPGQYLARFGQVFGKVILFCSLDQTFSAVWFYGLLGLLTLNLLACVITRLWKNMTRSMTVSFLSTLDDLDGLKHQFSFTVQNPADAVEKAVLRALEQKRFRCRTDKNTLQISGKKGSLKEFGSIIFHLSIILLFLGGLIGKFGGFSYNQELWNGQILTVQDRPFLIRSDWFAIDTNADGSIKDYRAHLTLLNPDSSVILQKIIEVNNPLSYQGVRFYQSDWKPEGDSIKRALLRVIAPENTFEGYFPINQPVTLPGAGFTVEVKKFLCDFYLDSVPRSRTRLHKNPAVLVTFDDLKGTRYDQWSFKRHPNVHTAKGQWSASLVDYDPALNGHTVLQVKYSPGTVLIWIGIICMTLGIFAMFYISKQTLWVFVTKTDDNACSVSIGGHSDRIPASFQGEFQEICGFIRKTATEGGN